ncbi:hypothetical protein [Candidatus Poriferisodalis sp.]|uniref:hypothetical protein n=1 Tax=Candidatus Poriferisodalis sp. TaxID=3101277 RepID=UPI003B5B1BAB
MLSESGIDEFEIEITVIELPAQRDTVLDAGLHALSRDALAGAAREFIADPIEGVAPISSRRSL